MPDAAWRWTDPSALGSWQAASRVKHAGAPAVPSIDISPCERHESGGAANQRRKAETPVWRSPVLSLRPARPLAWQPARTLRAQLPGPPGSMLRRSDTPYGTSAANHLSTMSTGAAKDHDHMFHQVMFGQNAWQHDASSASREDIRMDVDRPDSVHHPTASPASSSALQSSCAASSP